MNGSQGGTDEVFLLDFLLDDDGLVDAMRELEYAVLIPSQCSDDVWNGREELSCDQDDEDCLEAQRTRFSFDTVVEALQIVDANYQEIEHLFIGGVSGGGVGAMLLAHDLNLRAEEFEGRFRGAIADSASYDPQKTADLFELAEGEREVDTDSNCSNPPEAVVPCSRLNEPIDTAIVKIGIANRSGVLDIDAQLSEDPTAVPILHLYNRRDQEFCSDFCYSQEHLHGPLSGAIEDRKAGGINERFDFSENVEACAGSCRDPDDEIVHCVRHGLLGNHAASHPVAGALECAVDWVVEVNENWEGDVSDWDDYVTPASCTATIEEISMDPTNSCAGEEAMVW